MKPIGKIFKKPKRGIKMVMSRVKAEVQRQVWKEVNKGPQFEAIEEKDHLVEDAVSDVARDSN